MDYKEKYEEALNKAKEIYFRNDATGGGKIILEGMFPELKESEDEKIRKEIIQSIQDNMCVIHKDKCIAWLEKQGEQNNLLNFDEAEKEKNDFVSGQFIECRKSFNEFKELESYWLEYVGDDTYIGRSDNILNQRFHITPQQLFTLFTHEHCPKEETQDEQKSSWSEEDKIRYESCLNRLGTGNPEQPETMNTVWFKEHVKPNNWKPSKKQMEVLKKRTKSEDLEKAAKEYVRITPHHDIGIRPIPFNVNIRDLYNRYDIIDSFITGAEWQKQQMMKDALSGQIYRSHDGDVKILAVKGNTDKLYRGTDIKFIIVKPE